MYSPRLRQGRNRVFTYSTFSIAVPHLQCIDKKRTSAKRRGQRYKIDLENKDAKCTDKDNRTYQYGQFEGVKVSEI